MAQAVGFSRALAAVRRTVAARRDAKRRARAVRIPPCSPCIVCRKNKKQHPAGCCLWRRRWDSNPRDIAVKLISSATPSTSWVMLLIVIPQNLLRKKGRKVGENSKYLIVENRGFLTRGSLENQWQLPKCLLDFESSTSRYSSYISLFCFALKRLFSVLTLVFDILTYFVLYVARGCLGNIWATIVFRATLFGTTQGKLKICTEFEDLAIFQSKSFFFVWRFYREKHKFCC